MTSQPTSFLNQFVGCQVSEIWAFEFKDEADEATPLTFFISFNQADSFLKMELESDGEHILVEVYPAEQFNDILSKNTGDEFYWKPNNWTEKEPFTKVVEKPIDKVELAVDKLNNGRQSLTSIRFHFGTDNLIFFNNGDESFFAVNSKIEPEFPETYEWFGTEKK